MSDPTLTIDDLNALPEKMRAHAAAKAVGMTSKEFLAAMAGIGVEIKSAQSGVTREVLLTWFAGRDRAPGADAAAEPEAAPARESVAEESAASGPGADAEPTAAPAKKAPARKATRSRSAARGSAAETAAGTGESGSAPAAPEASATEQPAVEEAATAGSASAQPADTEPAKKAPRKRAPRKTAAQKAAEAAADAGARPADSGERGQAASGETSASAPARSQERPALPEIAIVTGEVGSAEPGNRRRRSTASPSFSPLFLSPDDSAAKASPARDTPARDTSVRETPAGDTSATRSTAAGTPVADLSEEDARVDLDAGAGGDRREEDQSEQGEGGSRRRRRGRRGRGRGRGEGVDEQDGTGTENDADDADDDTVAAATGREAESGSDETSTSGRDGSAGDAPDSADAGEGASGSDEGGSEDDSDGSEASPSGSRRRRRRRRRSGGSGSDDSQSSSDETDGQDRDPAERDARRRTTRGAQSPGGTSADEVQGITGSTRLEAKRQRRRDGREAGRRRQPILSESEFLARRESVDRVMVVREKARTDGKGIMTQVGVLEDKVLVEHFVTTESARSMVGNVYLGRVQNVLPSMEAAFVDIGRGRNGVLYAGEVNWEAAGLGGKARRIEQALKPGDMVLVQVTKDPIGQKGARLSTQISLAGRFLVYVPDGNSAGISRKLPDTERRRLKAILKDVVPEGSGVIIRTAAEGVSAEEIGRDVERLAAQWTEISEAAAKRTESGSGTPVALYEEPDLLVKVVRDLFNEDFSTLVIQGETSWNTVHDYVSRVAPEMVERLERYENPDVDVFATYRVDEQLAKALDRKVWLPSGGSLVIDRTEAMTVIDVNTGKYTGSGGNLEETVTKNNLEAAEEIVRQLRLRDVGGMVIIDFIDMVLEANRDLVLRRLTEALGRDRTRHQVSEVTSLGLVQLTRKKLGTGLVEAFSTPCEHCQGRGLIVHADPIHTESHNADEPGSKRRRRGGKGGDGSATPAEASASKPAPRKDGPAPAAHPAALAMGRQTGGDETGGTGKPDTADATGAVTEAAAETVPADAPTAAASAAQESAAAAESVTGESTSSGPGSTEPASTEPGAAEPGSTETAPARPGSGTDVAESSDAVGSTRPARRRRATRRAPSTAPAPVTAAVDSSAAEVAETPRAEAEAVGEAATAVAEATAPRDASAVTGTVDQPGRRPRRRATRSVSGAPAEASTPTPVVEAPAADAEAAPLAEAPTAVVAEPRKRPARRRATRSTTAPGSD